jgi:hypothetical protein
MDAIIAFFCWHTEYKLKRIQLTWSTSVSYLGAEDPVGQGRAFTIPRLRHRSPPRLALKRQGRMKNATHLDHVRGLSTVVMAAIYRLKRHAAVVLSSVRSFSRVPDTGTQRHLAFQPVILTSPMQCAEGDQQTRWTAPTPAVLQPSVLFSEDSKSLQRSHQVAAWRSVAPNQTSLYS